MDQRPSGDDRPDLAGALRERWFACSSALGWAAPAEWPDPTVDGVCAAVTARGGPDRERGVERALTRWAGARAAAGVGLAETLSDLAALHTAVSGTSGPPGHGAERSWTPGTSGHGAERSWTPGTSGHGAERSWTPGASGHGAEQSWTPGSGDGATTRPTRSPDGARLLRVVSLAWTDVACGDLAETAAVDPLSGLASVRYLRTRLAEIYRAARARGVVAGEEHALVTVVIEVHGWTRVAPLSVAGSAAEVVFDAGESLAVVGRGTVVVLAPRSGLAERTRVLRRLLARRLAAAGVAAPTVRIVPLPGTHGGACALLERLRAAQAPPAPDVDGPTA